MSTEPLHMLDELTACAYRLGLAFGRAAEAAETQAQRMAFFHPFDRCFFSVRVAIHLSQRLEQGVRPAGVRAVTAPPVESIRPDRPDWTERPEPHLDRERDRDREPASLPILLRALSEVGDAAEKLPGPPPAELPRLRELLTLVGGQPKAPPKAPLRARLAGAATVHVLDLPPAQPLHRKPSPVLPFRPTTGPPPRRR